MIVLAALLGVAAAFVLLASAIGLMLWPPVADDNRVEESPHDLLWLTQPPPGRAAIEAQPAPEFPLAAAPTLALDVRPYYWRGPQHAAVDSRLRTAPYVLARREQLPTGEYPWLKEIL